MGIKKYRGVLNYTNKYLNMIQLLILVSTLTFLDFDFLEVYIFLDICVYTGIYKCLVVCSYVQVHCDHGLGQG